MKEQPQPVPDPLARSYCFGRFTLDLLRGSLCSGQDEVKLRPKSFELLRYLVENTGRLVAKEELIAAVWPDVAVTDDSLVLCIKEVRRALDDDAQAFIKTVPRRGYLFDSEVTRGSSPPHSRAGGPAEPTRLLPVQPVKRRAGLRAIIQRCLNKEPGQRYQRAGEVRAALESLPSESASVSQLAPPSRFARRWPLAAAGVLLAVAAVFVGLNVAGWRERLSGRTGSPRIQSLAVLPLENLSGDKEQEYFADGMTEVLITDLAQISALRVISRTSAMRYKGTTKPLPEIASELHVDAVVTGTVARAAERVRITAELIYAPTDRHLWAKSYERDLRDVLALQSSVADAIAGEIRVKLTPQEQVRLASVRPVNPDAQEAYLKGRYYWHEDADAKKSLEYLLQATEKDPGYARAYAALAGIYGLLANYGYLPLEETHAKWEAAATKAMELDDTLADAHQSLAVLKFYRDWDWQGSEREFKRAIELSPSQAEAHQWYSDNLLATGRLAAAVAEIKRAQELDPLSRSLNEMLPERLYYARQYDQAIEQARKVLELYPNSNRAHLFLGLAYEQQSKLDQAIAEFQKAITRSTDIDSIAALGHAHALAGRRAEAQKAIAKLIELPEQHYRLFSIGVIYAGLGERDKAFARLGKAAVDRHFEMPELKVDPRLDSLRADPRFQELLLRMGLPP